MTKAGGRQHDDSGAVCERRQAGAGGAADMERRQAVEINLVGARPQHDRVAPTLHNQAAMGVTRQLRQTGGAAGVEQPSDVVAADRAGKPQPVIAPGVEFALEMQRVSVGPLRRPTDPDHRGQRRYGLADRFHFLPDTRKNVRIGPEQHATAGFAQQLGDSAGFEQKIDRISDPGRLGAEHGEEGFGQDRQQHRDRVVRPDAKPMKQVGGLYQAPPEVAVGDVTRGRLRRRRCEIAHRQLVGMQRRDPHQQLEHRMIRPIMLERVALQRFDIS